MLSLIGQVPPEALTTIERYGSFGIIVVIVILFVYRVIPKTIETFREMSTEFTKSTEAQRTLFAEQLDLERKSREEMHSRCEDSHTEKTRALIELVSTVTSLSSDRQAQIKPGSGKHRTIPRQPPPTNE